MIEQTLPGVAAVNYVYDAQGQLSGLTEGGRSWQYSYDANGRLATATDPLGRSTQFDYDQADRLTRQTLPDGREVGYAYDAERNLTRVNGPYGAALSMSYEGFLLTGMGWIGEVDGAYDDMMRNRPAAPDRRQQTISGHRIQR